MHVQHFLISKSCLSRLLNGYTKEHINTRIKELRINRFNAARGLHGSEMKKL